MVEHQPRPSQTEQITGESLESVVALLRGANSLPNPGDQAIVDQGLPDNPNDQEGVDRFEAANNRISYTRVALRQAYQLGAEEMRIVIDEIEEYLYNNPHEYVDPDATPTENPDAAPSQEEQQHAESREEQMARERREKKRRNREANTFHLDRGRERREKSIADIIERRVVNVEELIDKVSATSFEELKKKEAELKYGSGVVGRLKSFLAGEQDFTDYDGRNHDAWQELKRRGLRTLLNKKTITSAAVAGIMGILTGGVGVVGGAIVLGTIGGRFIGEVIDYSRGETRSARKELLLAEKARWAEMKAICDLIDRKTNAEGDLELIKELEAQIEEVDQLIDKAEINLGDPDSTDAMDHSQRLATLERLKGEKTELYKKLERASMPDKELADRLRDALLAIYHDQSESAAIDELDRRIREMKVTDTEATVPKEMFGYRPGSSTELKTAFEQKIDQYENVMRKWQNFGALAGGIAGIAENIMSGSLDHINLDMKEWFNSSSGQDVWHRVINDNNSWHYLYNSPSELHNVIQHQLTTGGNAWAHHAINTDILRTTGELAAKMPDAGSTIGGTPTEYIAALIAERALPVMLAAFLVGRAKRENVVEKSVKVKISDDKSRSNREESSDQNRTETATSSDVATENKAKEKTKERVQVAGTAERVGYLAGLWGVEVPSTPLGVTAGWTSKRYSKQQIGELNRKLQYWRGRDDENDYRFVCESRPKDNKIIVGKWKELSSDTNTPEADIQREMYTETMTFDEFFQRFTDPVIYNDLDQREPEQRQATDPNRRESNPSNEKSVDDYIALIKQGLESKAFDESLLNEKLNQKSSEAIARVLHELQNAHEIIDTALPQLTFSSSNNPPVLRAILSNDNGEEEGAMAVGQEGDRYSVKRSYFDRESNSYIKDRTITKAKSALLFLKKINKLIKEVQPVSDPNHNPEEEAKREIEEAAVRLAELLTQQDEPNDLEKNEFDLYDKKTAVEVFNKALRNLEKTNLYDIGLSENDPYNGKQNASGEFENEWYGVFGTNPDKGAAGDMHENIVIGRFKDRKDGYKEKYTIYHAVAQKDGTTNPATGTDNYVTLSDDDISPSVAIDLLRKWI